MLRLLGFKEPIKTTEPLLDCCAAEAEVATETLETGNLTGVRTHPVKGHNQYDGKLSIGKKWWECRERGLGRSSLKLSQGLPPYEVAG